MKPFELRARILLAVMASNGCGGLEMTSTARPDSDASDDGRTREGGRPMPFVDAASERKAPHDLVVSDAALDPHDHAIDAAADANFGGRDDAARDAAESGTVDARMDAEPDQHVADGALACSPYGGPCTKASDCCSGICNNFSPCTQPGGCICYYSIRRPFLVGTSLRVATGVERSDWQLDSDEVVAAADVDPATAEALGHDWLRDACDEHASVAAFARFTMHLASVGAPPAMLVASQRAAIDEVRHARACFTLATRYAARTMGPADLSLAGAVVPLTLSEIAALTAEEGCVGETLGALLAEEQLLRTTDPIVRAVVGRANIAADEARHAELAWSFVAWAVRRGGEPVRRAVAAAIGRAVRETLAMPIRTYDGVDLEAWRAHGRLTCAEAHAVVERGVREIIEPCAAALLDLPPPTVTNHRTTATTQVC